MKEAQHQRKMFYRHKVLRTVAVVVDIYCCDCSFENPYLLRKPLMPKKSNNFVDSFCSFQKLRFFVTCFVLFEGECSKKMFAKRLVNYY